MRIELDFFLKYKTSFQDSLQLTINKHFNQLQKMILRHNRNKIYRQLLDSMWIPLFPNITNCAFTIFLVLRDL